MASLSVGSERVSQVVGYDLTGANFSETTPNLPQRVVVIGEANESNQSTLSVSPKEYTNAQQVGQDYGYGSPIHRVMSILRPVSGDGIGGIPTIVIAQPKAVASVANIIHVVPTGTATKNGTHTLVINGRDGLNGVFYDINIVTGDSVGEIIDKINTAINAVLGTPVIATVNAAYSILTAKWAGLTSSEINVSIDTKGDGLGITYVVTNPTVGSGTPSIQAALDTFGNEWNTIVINTYGANSNVMSTLEAFNGKPRNGSNAPTGRYAGIIMKPFVAFTGSVLEDPSSITDTRLDEVTICIAPAPLSDGFHFEAATNLAMLHARIAQDTPELDVNKLYYSDMPTPSNIGAMMDYNNRDSIVKKGCSTVDLVGGKYVVMDSVTTYHPIGESVPQFMYVRNLYLDLNIKFTEELLVLQYIMGKVIAQDNDIVTSNNVVKPKQWKQILSSMAKDLVKRALIVDETFMTDSITVSIGTTNPDRLDTFFRYKRSGVARISATTAEAGFNFGNV